MMASYSPVSDRSISVGSHLVWSLPISRILVSQPSCSVIMFIPTAAESLKDLSPSWLVTTKQNLGLEGSAELPDWVSVVLLLLQPASRPSSRVAPRARDRIRFFMLDTPFPY